MLKLSNSLIFKRFDNQKYIISKINECRKLVKLQDFAQRDKETAFEVEK